MLLTGSRLIDTPVMGLQTGSELARTRRAVINPATLEIVAYELAGPLLGGQPTLLRIADVREFSDVGLIVDGSDEFITPDDVITVGKVYDLHFVLDGMPVVDEKRRKLGKVNGYTLDTSGFLVQQLSVKRPLLRSLNETELLIHRTQITEINDKAIVVESTAKIPEATVESLKTAYINPFRSSTPEAEHAERH